MIMVSVKWITNRGKMAWLGGVACLHVYTFTRELCEGNQAKCTKQLRKIGEPSPRDSWVLPLDTSMKVYYNKIVKFIS